MPNTILTDAQINQMIDEVIADNGPESITAEADNQLRKDIYANIKKLTGEKILIDAEVASGATQETILIIELPPLVQDRIIYVDFVGIGISTTPGLEGANFARVDKQNTVFYQKIADGSITWLGNFLSGQFQAGSTGNLKSYLNTVEIDFAKYLVVTADNSCPYFARFTGHVTINISNL